MSGRFENSTVWLVDDDASIRSALGRGLQAEGFQVMSWPSADEFLASYDPARPGCLVADIAMPGIDGMLLQRTLRERNISLPIVFVTGNGDVRTSVQAMRAGAITFLQKPVRLADLVAAVREGFALDLEARNRQSAGGSIRSRIETLTPRERQVFDLVIQGRMNKQIAAQLGASEKTVKVHRGRVMTKMKALSVAQLVNLALAAQTQ